MIKKENLKDLLKKLHFTNDDNNNYVKFYNDADSIIIDVKNENIIWPNDLIVNDKTTSNFDHNENFVVLECVDRLLSKGYFARNMELEPRWNLGHDAKGGKADILIKDNNGNAFLIIECKTFGEKFDEEWQNTLNDGGQLFSYAQQIRATQYLCLYASDFDGDKIVYNNKIMTLKDNEDFLKTLKLAKRLRYKDASDVKELFKVWNDVYNKEYEETGIFEDNISPYEINKNYSIKDLKTISFEDTQRKYNEFATILRQHNVSGHENAFDKLVNIFLAKIVDEIEHPDDLKFNWKGIAFDDYYQLQDRLQKLYKDGMRKFLNEDVTYIENKQLNDAFKLFKNDPDATKDKVQELFRQLKFYTNNDFAFIDVHNEDLFKQNSEVLLKVVKMFQDVKLKTDEQNQFLGDLFEGFLDDGVKQSEGQYFTPLPITRFMISSLPLKDIIETSDDYPYVIDYACGAGHFLNEYADQIKKYINDEEKLQNCFSHIYGIEKEYRLSKVSKVSAFMYGQDNINIIYGDALVNNKNIIDNTYSVLIANPPYSVKGFLETIDEDNLKNYNLTKKVNKNSYSSFDCIESFFVERASQLLMPDGVAAIILPSPLLTNVAGSTDRETRNILLEKFDIISIVSLPPSTFGKTGTKTIALFLRKKSDNPDLASHYKNRVNDWFKNDFTKDKLFDDRELFLKYLEYQDINEDDYIEFIKGNITDTIKESEVFDSYLDCKKPKSYDDIVKIEKEKMYYFLLANSQENDVLIVNSPNKNSEEIKSFLGYEWSDKKGKEGIKYINQQSTEVLNKNKGISSISTPLFNPNNLFDDEKINSIIRNNYNGIVSNKLPKNTSYVSLVDMIDFKHSEFDLKIDVKVESRFKLSTNYESKKLIKLAKISGGSGFPKEYQGNKDDSLIPFYKVRDMNSEGNEKYMNKSNNYVSEDTLRNTLKANIFEKDTIIFPKIGMAINTDKKRLLSRKSAVDNNTMTLTVIDDSILSPMYLYYYMVGVIRLEYFASPSNPPTISASSIGRMPIPLPEKEMQEKLVNECKKLEKNFENSNMSQANYIKSIEDKFYELGIMNKIDD